MKDTTKYETNFVESRKVLYPSVSICTKYTFKSATVNREMFAENKSLEEQKSFVMGKIWKKDEVFTFVNHPGIFGLSFPCVTLNDGTDPVTSSTGNISLNFRKVIPRALTHICNV